MCGGDASWKREEVPEHKFDFIDVRDFRDLSTGMRLKYLFMYGVIFKSFIVYISDIFTAITKFTTQNWAENIIESCEVKGGCFYIPPTVNKWLFLGCIIFSFLLLGWEGRKSRKIIASRDISYAFTNVMANRYYCLRSYDHFCFFDHISNSTKKQDDFAFFIFFTFKGWKRLLLADTPRQTINALTLYSLYYSARDDGAWWDVPKYFVGRPLSTQAVIATSIFTVLICAVSLIQLAIASIAYIPLLFYIQGNLKEYVCHKVDKRTAEFIKRRNKVRHARAAKLAALEAKGDFSHLGADGPRLPQPTLPQVSLDDDDDATEVDFKSMKKSLGAPSEYGGSEYQDHKTDFPPPMPGYAGFNDADSQYHLGNGFYEDEYATSHAHLTSQAAPIAGAEAYEMPQVAYQQNQYAHSAYAPSQQTRSHTPVAHYDYDQYSQAPSGPNDLSYTTADSITGQEWPQPPTHSQPPMTSGEMHEMHATSRHDAGYHAM